MIQTNITNQATQVRSISPSEKQLSGLKGKDKNLETSIKSINNSKENKNNPKILHSKIGELTEKLTKNKGEYTENFNNLKKLTKELKNEKEKISKLSGTIENVSKSGHITDDTELRKKNGILKPANETSCLKNFFNKSRYTTEIKKAQDEFGSKDSAVTIGFLKDKIETLKNNIANTENKLEQLKVKNNSAIDKHEALTSEIKNLEKELKSFEENITRSKNRRTSLSPVAKQAAKKKIDTNAANRNKEFALIYQTNAGCAALNKAAQQKFNGKKINNTLSSKDVKDEYHRTRGDEYRGKEWEEHNLKIKLVCDEPIEKIINNATNDLYNPSGDMATSWRGQGITREGFDQIYQDFKEKQSQDKSLYPVYQAARFYSTSDDYNQAKEFSTAKNGEIPIMIKVRGNSGNKMSSLIPHGLKFGDGSEKERLYSPKACFAVTNIDVKKRIIHLHEVAYKDHTPNMPY